MSSACLLMCYTLVLNAMNGKHFLDITDSLYMVIGTWSSIMFYLGYAAEVPSIIYLIESIKGIVHKSRHFDKVFFFFFFF